MKRLFAEGKEIPEESSFSDLIKISLKDRLLFITEIMETGRRGAEGEDGNNFVPLR